MCLFQFSLVNHLWIASLLSRVGEDPQWFLGTARMKWTGKQIINSLVMVMRMTMMMTMMMIVVIKSHFVCMKPRLN